MAKGEQPGVADNDGAIKLDANAGIADIAAETNKRLISDDKIDVKAGCDAARPVFEFADAFQVRHSGGLLSILEAG
jgi:hypothetical protein